MLNEELILAVKNGNIYAIKNLVLEGASVNAESNFFIEDNVLKMAVLADKIEIVSLLIELGADVNLRKLGGSTALMIAAAQPLGNGEIAKKLIDAGADVNAKLSDGSTALSTAKLVNPLVANILIAAGAKE